MPIIVLNVRANAQLTRRSISRQIYIITIYRNNLALRYWVTMDMETELRSTCHFARVNDIIFPAGCSDLFITCSVADIRVWNAALRQELLRIQVRSQS